MRVVTVEKKDLKHNIKQIKNISSEDYKLIGVVKGNGYGLGLVQYSKNLIDNGIDFLAVATIEEAITLRKADINVDILMLSSTGIVSELETLIQNNIIITIGSIEEAKKANEIGIKNKVKVRAHIKIDTGFGRYGFVHDSDIKDIIEVYKEYNNLQIEGTFSHFSQSYAKDEKHTKLQFDRFINVIEILKMNDINPGMLHICNSSAFLRYTHMHLNAARIGSAFTGRLIIPNTIGLKKVGQVKAEIAEIKVLPKGHNIGYSNVYKTKKETKVAVIPFGYKDGFTMNVKDAETMFMHKVKNFVKAGINLFKKKDIYVEINKNKCKVLGQVRYVSFYSGYY